MAIVEAPGMAEPLLAAPPQQRRAILYFAAAQYLLRGPAAGHPLAGYLPTLAGVRPLDDRLVPTFVDFVHLHGNRLAEVCATRTTQTNEARRSALLRPGFGRAIRKLHHRPVSLVELGTSAGLLLLPDRYGYRYGVARYGRRDAGPALTMSCAPRGSLPTDLDVEPVIADRVGLDLHPIAADDPDAADWLRSCIWPEHVDRLARLDAALAEAAAVKPRMVAGDMVAGLADVLSTVEGVPLVFASNAVTYLPAAARAELVALLAAEGARRDLAVVFNEAEQCGLRLFATGGPAPDKAQAVTVLTVVTWLAGRASVTALGRGGPHGEWLSWEPAEHAYRPVNAAG
jgi:hypothetical protein